MAKRAALARVNVIGGGAGSVHSLRKGYVAEVIPKEPSSSRSEERKSPSWVAKLMC